MNNIAIEVLGLKKSFGELNVLSDISFDVSTGEVVTFLGPSGSGKTTLLNCLTGIDKSYQGRIKINDISQKEYLLSNRIGMVTQKYGNFPWLTVQQNIKLGEDSSIEQSESGIQNIIKSIELTDFESYFPSQLSGGMQQRVAIGRVIAQNSDILAMDEPFGALDYMTRTSLQGLLKRLNNRYDKTILFITHDVEEAIFISDRIIILSKTPTVIAKEIIVPDEIKQSIKSNVRYTNTFVKLRSEIETILSSLEKFKDIKQIFDSKDFDNLISIDYWNTFIINQCRLSYERLTNDEQIQLSLRLLNSPIKSDVIIGSLLHKDVSHEKIKNKLKKSLKEVKESDFEMSYWLLQSLTNMKSTKKEKEFYRNLVLDNLENYLLYEKRYFTLNGLLDDSIIIRLVESRFKGDNIINLENKGWLIIISSLAHNNKKAIIDFLNAVIGDDISDDYKFSEFDKETAQKLLKNID